MENCAQNEHVVFSPCARSEKRPRNEVSFHLPGNICFFALMGRKHDAEVEFTCCHSQKSAKVGFSKGFLSDLIGPDHVVDTILGAAGVAPLPRWNHGDFVRNSVRGRGEMIKTSIKGVIPFVQKKTTYTFLWQEKYSSFFFQKSREKSLKILLNMHGHCKHNSVEEASEDWLKTVSVIVWRKWKAGWQWHWPGLNFL